MDFYVIEFFVLCGMCIYFLIVFDIFILCGGLNIDEILYLVIMVEVKLFLFFFLFFVIVVIIIFVYSICVGLVCYVG